MDYIKITKDLIALNTTVPPGLNYEKTMDYLQPLFEQTRFSTQKIAIPADEAEGRQDRFAMIAHRRQPGAPRLIFYAHVDVVPAEGWDAFNPVVKDGKIFGRGAADMKGGLVALLIALDNCRDSVLKYDISVLVTVDEEYSQASQLRYLKKYVEPVKGASVFSLDSNFGSVNIAGLGLLQVNINVKGKSVHSGLAHLGSNAVENAVPLLNALLELKKKVIARKSRIPVNPDTGLEYMESKLNINIVRGGIKTNIVPDNCYISIDRRLIPEENLSEAEKELMDVLNSVAGVVWEVDEIFRIPTVQPCQDAIVDELYELIKEVTGKSGKFGEMGSGDLSWIVCSEWLCNIFGLGVIRTECNIHGVNEFVYQNDIQKLGDIISRFIKK